MLDVAFDGALGDKDATCDFAIRHALGHEQRHLSLAPGQGRRLAIRLHGERGGKEAIRPAMLLRIRPPGMSPERSSALGVGRWERGEDTDQGALKDLKAVKER